jgi:hypothetical protein
MYTMDFDQNLPATPDQLAQNLEAALTTIGSGGGSGMAGVQFMKIDHRTGAVTCGRDSIPVPLQHRYAVPVALIRHGFKVWESGLVTAQVMEPIAAHPALPMPKTPYVVFGQNGPRKAMELILLSLDEPGFNLSYGVLNVSSENEVNRLVADALGQIRAGHAAYANPVIKIRPQLCNYRKFGTSGWAFGHELVDFISNDGATLWSKVKMVEDPGELPWDTGGGEDAGETL